MLSFGSVARGEDTSSSDLDIAIIITGIARVV
jgi:predicted nucleotidyltransferase